MSVFHAGVFSYQVMDDLYNSGNRLLTEEMSILAAALKYAAAKRAATNCFDMTVAAFDKSS
jgi:hypothetical protein